MRPNETLERVYTALIEFIGREGIPPTRRELAKATGLSKTTVADCLGELATQGRIKYEPRRHRGVNITK